MNTIFHEMSLPVDRRAGPPVVAISSSSRREEVSYTSEEQAIRKLITRYDNAAKIKVKMANSTLTAKSGYRANQQKLKELFDAAAALGIGKRQGVPNNGLCLELALETVPDATKNGCNCQ